MNHINLKQMFSFENVARCCHPIVLNNTLVRLEQSVSELTDIGGLSRGERHSISDVTAGETANFNSVSEKGEVLPVPVLAESPRMDGSDRLSRAQSESPLHVGEALESNGIVRPAGVKDSADSRGGQHSSHFCGPEPHVEFHPFLLTDETPIEPTQN